MRNFLNNLKRKAAALKNEMFIIYLLAKHKNTPLYTRLLALLTIGYLLSPLDLIPDFIPVLGLLDDLIIVPVLITLTIKSVPAELYRQCAEEAEQTQVQLRKKWYLAIPFIIFWLLMGLLLYYTLLPAFTESNN